MNPLRTPIAERASRLKKRALQVVLPDRSVGCAEIELDHGQAVLFQPAPLSGGDKSLGSGDSLSVQGTFTQADDGV
jgi:hypothetical protein